MNVSQVFPRMGLGVGGRRQVALPRLLRGPLVLSVRQLSCLATQVVANCFWVPLVVNTSFGYYSVALIYGKKSHKKWVCVTNHARQGLHVDIIYTFPLSSYCFSWIFKFPLQLAYWIFIIATAFLVIYTHFPETSKGLIVYHEEQDPKLSHKLWMSA